MKMMPGGRGGYGIGQDSQRGLRTPILHGRALHTPVLHGPLRDSLISQLQILRVYSPFENCKNGETWKMERTVKMAVLSSLVSVTSFMFTIAHEMGRVSIGSKQQFIY